MAQHEKRLKHMADRLAQGLTHRELGEEYGVSRQHIGRLLKNKSKNKDKEE